MKQFIFAVLLFLSYLGNAMAVIQARDGAGNTVTLHGDPCTTPAVIAQIPRLNAILADIGMPPKSAADFISASLLFEGKVLKACATDLGPMVIVIDEAGLESSIFPVPARDFKNVEGI